MKIFHSNYHIKSTIHLCKKQDPMEFSQIDSNFPYIFTIYREKYKTSLNSHRTSVNTWKKFVNFYHKKMQKPKHIVILQNLCILVNYVQDHTEFSLIYSNSTYIFTIYMEKYKTILNSHSTSVNKWKKSVNFYQKNMNKPKHVGLLLNLCNIGKLCVFLTNRFVCFHSHLVDSHNHCSFTSA